jgi:hypothetical protein
MKTSNLASCDFEIAELSPENRTVNVTKLSVVKLIEVTLLSPAEFSATTESTYFVFLVKPVSVVAVVPPSTFAARDSPK